MRVFRIVRRILASLSSQFRQFSVHILFVLLFSAVPLVTISVLHHLKGTRLSNFTRDPADVTGVFPHVGVLSNIGVCLWSAAAAIFLFTATVLFRNSRQSAQWRFLAAFGSLTGYLMLDDLLLLHDLVFPRFFGIPEIATYIVYVSLFVFCLIYFASAIYQTNYALLFMSLIFFSFSVLVDLGNETDLSIYIEDGCKFIGISFWLLYFFDTASMALGSSAEPV